MQQTLLLVSVPLPQKLSECNRHCWRYTSPSLLPMKDAVGVFLALAAVDKNYHDGTMVPSCTMARERLRHKANLRYFSFSRSLCDRVWKTKQNMWKTNSVSALWKPHKTFFLLLFAFFFLNKLNLFHQNFCPESNVILCESAATKQHSSAASF